MAVRIEKELGNSLRKRGNNKKSIFLYNIFCIILYYDLGSLELNCKLTITNRAILFVKF